MVLPLQDLERRVQGTQLQERPRVGEERPDPISGYYTETSTRLAFLLCRRG